MTRTITPAAPEDAAEILALQRLAYQSEARLYNDWSIPPLTQTLEELRADFSRMTILKALDEHGGIVGSVRGEMDGGVCRIGRLVVRPDRQRQGLGAALLAAIEAAHPQAARFALFTGSHSVGNLRLYARAGFVETDRREAKPGLTLVFLEKPGKAAS
ncbi:Predicted N-acetyltransferase YhbS [Humidesulfovibrio mexicanus]|uniref:Predicted N-acetyltransferase YhbS n=1 Tax=Humidesulfovibrio mexicanus TaxID=147047 RepID=A0A239B1B9_9BACT|nr:GNAT family N-acetyltransferase [Humidesulfovibrio mexicanus]SNS01756.1 Predicted N-acetyltransferase YhbS [Humidesulfovibrio mexicanus]